MTITVEVIEDSISVPLHDLADDHFIRLTTLQLRYPRFVHAEFMTHRVFSRNASSSRAIPVEKLIQDILDDTAMPIHWGKNQKGMQANEECDARMGFGAYKAHIGTGDNNSVYPLDDGPSYDLSREESWCEARDAAIHYALKFSEAGYHKQIVNRLLEPFSHINVVVSATEWSNFLELRDHKDAQPEIRELAIQIKNVMAASIPNQCEFGGHWHLPYVTMDERRGMPLQQQIKISVARCARTSYLTHDRQPPVIEADLKLYDRLVGSRPLHASPAEHQASPDIWLVEWWKKTEEQNNGWGSPELHGNFRGWKQYRKQLEQEVWST